MQTSKHVYNHRPDDAPQDLLFSDVVLSKDVLAKLPIKVDLRNSGDVPDVLNQGSLGSCTANACANAIRYCLKKEKDMSWMPSRLFMYYNGRVFEDNVNEDSGLSIRVLFRGVQKYGACSETLWPYIIDRFKTKPSSQAYKQALQHGKGFTFAGVKKKNLRQCLARGYPVIFGMAVYASFESPQVSSTGIVPMPRSGEQMLGGHCVLMVGYDDKTKMYFCQNSWGEKWGQDGFFQIPYEYIHNDQLTWDCWMITKFI